MDQNRSRLEFGRPPALVLTHACDRDVNPGSGGWHGFNVSFKKFGFRADVSLESRIDEFIPFRDALALMNSNLHGTAKLETLENDLALTATIDKLGHVTWEGYVGRYPLGGGDARLEFWVMDDQTCLANIIAQLEALIAEASRESEHEATETKPCV